MAALAKALEEVSLTKAQLGLELEELEAAAFLVQEEESASKAIHSLSGQHTPGSTSETSDSEETDSTAASESQDSDSDQEELKESPSGTVKALQSPFVEANTGVYRNPILWSTESNQGEPLASCKVPGEPKPLIEELGEQLETVVHVSESRGAAAGNQNDMQDRVIQET